MKRLNYSPSQHLVPPNLSFLVLIREEHNNSPTPPASRHFRDRPCYGPTLLVLWNGLLLSQGRGSNHDGYPSGQNRCTGTL